MYVCTYVCMYVCMYVCVCMCMHVYVCDCMCMYVYACLSGMDLNRYIYNIYTRDAKHSCVRKLMLEVRTLERINIRLLLIFWRRHFVPSTLGFCLWSPDTYRKKWTRTLIFGNYWPQPSPAPFVTR